jgi:hypothetical protein
LGRVLENRFFSNQEENMKTVLISSLIGACLLMLGGPVRGQDKSNPTKEEARSPQQDGPVLKLQIVFAEYEGEKKTKNLPYTLLFDTNRTARLRVGSRVPVATGKDNGALQYQYVDIGTNLDCSAKPTSDGKYLVTMFLERSWVEGDVFVYTGGEASTPDKRQDNMFRQPIIHQTKFDNTIIMRDGQTVETNLAADPLNGRVIKVEATFSIVK